MTPDSKTCSKCGGSMVDGFIPDLAYGTYTLGNWHPGTPTKSLWSGLKLQKDKLVPIGASRCSRCGFLDLYADARFAPR